VIWCGQICGQRDFWITRKFKNELNSKESVTFVKHDKSALVLQGNALALKVNVLKNKDRGHSI
jgi:hypothetical protein